MAKAKKFKKKTRNNIKLKKKEEEEKRCMICGEENCTDCLGNCC